jgi:hypothetical protein
MLRRLQSKMDLVWNPTLTCTVLNECYLVFLSTHIFVKLTNLVKAKCFILFLTLKRGPFFSFLVSRIEEVLVSSKLACIHCYADLNPLN